MGRPSSSNLSHSSSQTAAPSWIPGAQPGMEYKWLQSWFKNKELGWKWCTMDTSITNNMQLQLYGIEKESWKLYKDKPI